MESVILGMTLLLQEVPASGGKGGGGYSQLFIFALMIGVLYFFMIRPQQRRQREQRKYMEAVKKGDYAVTTGGIHGKILAIEEADTVLLEVDKGTKLRIDKSSLSKEASRRHQASLTKGLSKEGSEKQGEKQGETDT